MLDKILDPKFFVPALAVAFVAIALSNRVDFVRQLTG